MTKTTRKRRPSTSTAKQTDRATTAGGDSNRLLGSDVYEGDAMDWTQLKGQLFFLFMRAHYGTTVDTQFAKYWPAAKGIDLRCGAYGFIVPSQPVDEQVAAAVEAVNSIGGFKTGDMALWADAENERAWLKLPRSAKLLASQRRKAQREIVTAWQTAMPNATDRMDFLLAYLNGVKEKTNSPPGVYASPSFLSAVFTDLTPLAAEAELWIAHWKVSQPSIPAAFQKKTPPYRFWQDLGDAWACKGINGGKKNKADRDWFPGTVADFNARFGTPS